MPTPPNSEEPGLKLVPGDSFYDLIQEAYEAFAGAVPTDIGTCGPCCMYAEVYEDFFRPPIRELPFRYVQDWFSSAADPDLPQETWRYLLPRILEVIAAGEDPNMNGIEVSLNRFPTGHLTHWNKVQGAVLERFQVKFLAEFGLIHPETIHPLDDIICMFASAGWNLDSLFAQVEAWSDEVLVERLWSDWCDCPNPSIWHTAFWESPQKQASWAWYTSAELAERMLSAEKHLPAEFGKKASEVRSEILKARVTT